MYVIYKHTSPSGKAYIGLTNDYRRRCKDHKCLRGCSAFYNAIKTYGWDSFTHEILKENLSLDEANYWETLLIKAHNTLSPNGYNLRIGGEHGTVSEETRKVMSAANVKAMTPERRKKHSDVMKARVTPEILAQMSEDSKKALANPEVRAKMSDAAKKRMTPERIAELGKASKTPKARARQAEAMQKRMRTPEMRLKMANVQKGRRRSMETRMKCSESLKASYSDERRKLQAANGKKLATPEHLEKMKAGLLKPEVQKKRTALMRTPEYRMRQSEAAKKAWTSERQALHLERVQSEENRKRASESMKKIRAKRLAIKEKEGAMEGVNNFV